MRNQRTDTRLVNFSVSAYKILIALYPSMFREEYGPHMLQLFRDCCIRSHDQQGSVGMLSLWAVTLFDFVRSVTNEHLQKESFMSRRLFIRMSGWALILGGIAFTLLTAAASLQEILPYSYSRTLRAIEDELSLGVFVIGPVLVALGMVGLGLRYANEAGRLAQASCFVGAACGAVALPLAFLVEALLPRSVNPDGEFFIGTFIILVSTMFLCLALFGIISLRRKAMPRWNGSPVVAGLWLPAVVLVSLITTDNRYWNVALLPTVLLFLGATILVGYSLQADTAPQPVVVQ